YVSGTVAPSAQYTLYGKCAVQGTSVTYRDTYKVVNASGTTFSTTGLWAQIVVNATGTDGVTFVSETIPDNTTEPAGQSFTKTWTVRNTGTTTWDSSYSLQYVSSTSTSFCIHNTVYVSGTVAPSAQYT